MNCEIEWNNLSLEGWETRFSRIRRANLLQSYQYAQAVCPIYRQKARWGLIKINGAEAGLVQILEAGMAGNLIHALVLDRGPLWFSGFGGIDANEAFFAALAGQYPRRFGRRRRLIPETENDNRPSFELLGYKKRPGKPYETVWLDLTQDIDALRAGLHKKWRNMLTKAEKGGLQTVWDDHPAHLSWLLTNYQLDKAKKGYGGPSVRILRALGKTFGAQGRLLIGRAFTGSSNGSALDKEAVAAILILVHGSCATYQIGWNSEEGRKTAAHNLLLWQAACHLKENGISDLDLGGVNDDTAKGVKKFKEGMGGQTVGYAGHYF